MKFPRLRNKPTKKLRRTPRSTVYKKQPVFAYRSSRRESETARERGQDSPAKMGLLYRLRHVPTYLCFAAIITGILYSTTLNSHAQLVVAGQSVLPRSIDNYQRAIDQQFGSSLMNRSKITINTGKLSSEIQKQFPEFSSVDISLPLLRHRPVVQTRLAKPALQLVTPRVTYILDANGRALFDKKLASPDYDFSSLPSVTDASGHQVRLNKSALTSQQVSYVYSLSSQLTAKKLGIESMTLHAGAQELHVRLQGLGYVVKFNFGAEPRQSVGAYLATKERLDSDRAGVGEYIDVRLPERVYVK